MPKQDALTWFEIPAADLRRATQFYESGRSAGQAPATACYNRASLKEESR